MPSQIAKIYDWLEKKGIGKKEVHYHLRIGLFPVSVIGGRHSNDLCEKCGWNPVDEKDLPVELPYIEDYRPLGKNKSPLATHPEFYNTICPKCKEKQSEKPMFQIHFWTVLGIF